MSFEVVKVHSYDVGGLVVPGLEPGEEVRRSDLMAFTEDRIRSRGIDEVVVAYVHHPEAGWSAVVGYRCDGVDELQIGDSLVTVPTAYFAHFVIDRAEGDDGPAESLWEQVDLAQERGRIERAYGGEVAIIRPEGMTDLFIRLV